MNAGFIRSTTALARLAVVAVPLFAAACTPPTPPGTTTGVTYNQTLTAKVVDINKASRGLTLQLPDGRTVPLQVSNDVQNYDQIRVGDMVNAIYQERIDVEVMGKVTPIDGVIVNAAQANAPKGQKPAGGWAISAKRSVTIVSVDRTSHTVTFRETDGSLDSLVVKNPANYPIADGLQPGTVVNVTETAALAVAVSKI
jgi:hypothetical protein